MEHINYTENGNIATITICREHRMNALSPAAMFELGQALQQLEQASEVQVGIITGDGNRAFCAGADIHQTQAPSLNFLRGFLDRTARPDHPLYIRNIALPRMNLTKPLIAAVNGVAAGGGMELVLNCDIAIASKNARFGLPEVCIGSVPAVGGIQRLVRSLPRAKAMKFLLTGDLINAHEALEMGLIAQITEPDELLAIAIALAQRIARNAPLAVRAARYLAEKAHSLPLGEALELEELVWGHLYSTADRAEGRAAFSEKREPNFKGN